MAKIGDYVKADEVVCPECGEKLIYTAEVCGNEWYDLTDDGLAWSESDLDSNGDEFFVCTNDHEIPRWLYVIDLSDRYLKFASQEDFDKWIKEQYDEAQG